MFSRDPQPLHPSPPSICLVVPELPGLTGPGGIGPHYGSLAFTLARGGWNVHVLLAVAEVDLEEVRRPARSLPSAGIGCTWLGEMRFPPELAVGGPNQFPMLDRSERVRHALGELQRAHSFDLIEFPDQGGLGFRTVQARQAGLDFTASGLIVTVHGPSACHRAANGQWPTGPVDLAGDFCERQTFERADYQLGVAAASVEAVARLGWKVRPEVRVCPELGSEDKVLALYQELLETTKSRRTTLWGSPPDDPGPLVTVAVAHYNLGAYLRAALAALAAQTYRNLEVLVVDDGSTEPAAQEIIARLEGEYPHFRLLCQANAGIGATRNRALAVAQGEYFLPMDADNLARPDMIERLVAALQRNAGLAALSCYFLAFAEDSDIHSGRFAYSYRPLGGPQVLASLWNVYGDGNALFRTSALRAVGGFETDRDTSWEDWEVFLKLVNAGFEVDVLPEHLFYYRHRPSGFSRTTDGYRNHQRVLRRFCEAGQLAPAERIMLWNALAGFQRRLEHLEDENRGLRRRLGAPAHRLAERLFALLGKAPLLRRAGKYLLSARGRR